VQLWLSLTEGYPEHSVELRGLAGAAKLDLERNTFLSQRHTPYSRHFDLYHMNIHDGNTLKKQARQNLWNYLSAKLKFAPFDDPYYASLAHSIACFYLKKGIDPRHSGQFAKKVIAFCQNAIESVNIPRFSPKSKHPDHASAEILVLGGTGFVGQVLVKKLLKLGRPVKLLLRDPNKIDFESKDLIPVKGNILKREDLQKAIEGVKYVFHLARPYVNTWNDYQREEIETARSVGEICLENQVKRLVYTGTIDSFYAGDPKQVITENTPLDPHIERRNLYARAKAASEEVLQKMHKEQGLPLVIARPGIVIGKGAAPFHWGVGMWYYQSICQLWGKGNHPLPFVLVDDVAQALVQCMLLPNLEGKIFHLATANSLTARDYITELEKAISTKIEIIPSSIMGFYLTDLLKWLIKVLVRHPGRRLPSYRDWKSRSQLSKFDCSETKRILDWHPKEDRESLVKEGIIEPSQEWLK
jgi:nucleoside-diphosphate-sugar epimerase